MGALEGKAPFKKKDFLGGEFSGLMFYRWE